MPRPLFETCATTGLGVGDTGVLIFGALCERRTTDRGQDGRTVKQSLERRMRLACVMQQASDRDIFDKHFVEAELGREVASPIAHTLAMRLEENCTVGNKETIVIFAY